MTAYKGAEFWMRVTLAVLAGALFLTVHAVYWPVVISLILTFILMPIRDGVIKGLRGKADSNNDKKVTAIELFQYVHKDVQLHNKNQHPQMVTSKSLYNNVLMNWE